MRKIKMLLPVFVSCLSLLVFPFCTSTSISTGPGTGTETTNGIIASVHYLDGSIASNVAVKIRPSDFIRDTNNATISRGKNFIDTHTDSLGRVCVDSLESGSYTFEIINNRRGEGALLNCQVIDDSLNDYGIVFLDQLSTISGAVDTSEIGGSTNVFVQLYGVDVVKRVDPVTKLFKIDSIPSGNYTLKVITSNPLNMQEVVNGIRVNPDQVKHVDTVTIKSKESWLHTQKIYLNTTDSGANVMTSITRFPVLVRLNSQNFDFITAKSDGSDVCFVKRDNTPMPFQIERWDRDAQVAEIWVKVDTIYGNNKTQYFMMLWGNSDLSKINSNSALVFDTTLGIQATWHMGLSDGTTLEDATGNKFNAKCYAMTSGSSVQGCIGYAQQFNGSSSYAVVTNSCAGKLNFAEDSRYTISAWVYAEKLDNDFHAIISKSNHQYGLQLSKENTWRFFEYQNRMGWDCSDASATEKEWQFVVGVREGPIQRIYVNGVLSGTTKVLRPATSVRITSDNVCIGKRTADSTQWFNGKIDELRIYRWPNSINWIRLCYMNQRSDNKLISFENRVTILKE